MLHTIHHEAIWTHWTISRKWNDQHIWEGLMDLLNLFQKKYSRFDQKSLTWQLNLNRSVQTSDRMLIEMIQYGKKAQELTQGLFSLFVGSHLENLWYNSDYQFIPNWSKASIQGCDIVIWDNEISLIWNGNLDLGWLGKWFVIDELKKIILDQWVTSFLINWGGDIYQQDEESLWWPITLQDPKNSDLYIWSLTTKQWWYASSWTSFRQRWKWLHHLINAVTWLPVQTEIIWAFTYHPHSALAADLASTILFISPLEKIDYFASRLEVEYLIVFEDYSSVRSSHYPINLE
jgi:thiamine biosynthesis lipoprotein